MHCFGVTILGVLNQKHHEEGDDGRGRVDDQLPSVGKMKRRTGEEPNKNDEHGRRKCPGTSEDDGGTACEDAERVAYDAKEIAVILTFCLFLSVSSIHPAI